MTSMNPLHLLWIVPLSATVGFMWAVLLMAADTEDDEVLYDDDDRRSSGLLEED